MRLLFYISTLRGGGAGRVIANLANEFCKHGHIVSVVNTIQDPNDYCLEDGVQRVILSSAKDEFRNVVLKNFHLVRRLNLVLKSFNPDVAVSFMGEPNFRLLACASGVRKIISIRSDPKHEYQGLRGFLTKHLFFRCHGVVCQTEDVLNWLSPTIRKKSRVIINQVNPIFYKTNHLASDYYVATGRLDKAKNYDLLIRSFHDFRLIHENAKLFIFGEGALKKDIEKVIINNSDDDAIFLKGSSSDIPKVLSQAKAFILSSDYEGMPNGLLEAMAVGLPCISTDCPCGGPRTIIQNNVNGLLVPVGDKTAMVKALCKIEEDPLFSRNIALEAKKTAQKFAPERVYIEWLSFLQEVIMKY